MEALRLMTVGSAGSRARRTRRARWRSGKLADLAVLSADYFKVPDDEIKRLESVLTVVGGKVVYATKEFARLSPPPLPINPSWSPTAFYGSAATQGAGAPAPAMLHRLCSHAGEVFGWSKEEEANDFRGLGCPCFGF